MMPAQAILEALPKIHNGWLWAVAILFGLVLGVLLTKARDPFIFQRYLPRIYAGRWGPLYLYLVALLDFLLIVATGSFGVLLRPSRIFFLDQGSLRKSLFLLLLTSALVCLAVLCREDAWASLVFLLSSLMLTMTVFLYWVVAIRASKTTETLAEVAETEAKGGFGEILAVLAALFPVLVAAAIILDNRFDIFALSTVDNRGVAQILDYVTYVGAEFFKSLIVFDAYEIYDLPDWSALDARGALAQHYTFGIRCVFDLLIIGTLSRMYGMWTQSAGASPVKSDETA